MANVVSLDSFSDSPNFMRNANFPYRTPNSAPAHIGVTTPLVYQCIHATGNGDGNAYLVKEDCTQEGGHCFCLLLGRSIGVCLSFSDFDSSRR